MEYKVGDYVWLMSGELAIIDQICGKMLIIGRIVKNNLIDVLWQNCVLPHKQPTHIKRKANIKNK